LLVKVLVYIEFSCGNIGLGLFIKSEDRMFICFIDFGAFEPNETLT